MPRAALSATVAVYSAEPKGATAVGWTSGAGAAGQTDFAVLVQGVVVSHREGTLRGQEHAFEGFAEGLAWPAG